MKIAGKSFHEYLAVSRNFWIALFIIMGLTVVIRLSSYDPAWIQALLSISGALVLIWAGWSSVKRHGFELRQVSMVALILSLAVHWSLPIFHGSLEVFYLVFINSFVYTAMVVFGGLLAKISAK
jgi:hypothetical protein